MKNRLSKTLKQKSIEFNELESLYKHARAEAKSQIILGRLKLKILGWLEMSGPGNTHFKWETEEHSKEHWGELRLAEGDRRPYWLSNGRGFLA